MVLRNKKSFPNLKQSILIFTLQKSKGFDINFFLPCLQNKGNDMKNMSSKGGEII
jgi:hypothetical protein